MTTAGDDRIDLQTVEASYREYAEGLRAFLIGLLRDADLAAEALQATFVRAIESGHSARAETFRGWLFRVAYNEAMGLRRKQSLERKVLSKVAAEEPAPPDVCVTDRLMAAETAVRVGEAIKQLPDAQQVVVRMRIFDGLKFIQIAEQLDVPLGTVLTRMRLAVARLAKLLPDDKRS